MGCSKFYHKTFSARNFNSSSLTISGMKQDTVDYMVMISFKPASSVSSVLQLLPNGDTTNAREYEMRGSGGSVYGGTTDTTSMDIARVYNSNTHSLIMVKITGDSSGERYFDILGAGNSGTSGGGFPELMKKSNYWKDTSTELTSLELKTTGSHNADAEVIIWEIPKSNNMDGWELIGVHTLSSVNVNSSPDTFSGLSLDTDGEYLYEFDLIEANSIDLGMRVNSDSGANYTGQELQNSSGSISGQNRASYSNTYINDTGGSARIKGQYIFKGNSSIKRTIIGSHGQTAKAFHQISEIWRWNNTVNDLNSISLVSHTGSASSTSGTIKLYRKKNPNTVADYFGLPFKMSDKHSVSGNFSSGHTFTGINGDDIGILKLEFEGTGSNNGDRYFRLQLNSDTGSNYPYQWLSSYGATAAAASGTTTYIEVSNSSVGSFDEEGSFTVYIFPKSGEYRPVLFIQQSKYSTGYMNQLGCAWWNNSGDELNSLKAYISNTNSTNGDLKLSELGVAA